MPDVIGCQGFRAAFRHGAQGGYDGVDAWEVAAPVTRGRRLRIMVEEHESLHRELQASSGWGLVAALSTAVGDRRGAPREALRWMAALSEDTQECFATTMSAALLGVGTVRELLAGNAEYTAHLTRGLALTGDESAPWALREAALEAAARCFMSPGSVPALLDRGLTRLDTRAAFRVDRPDDRLAAFEAAGGPAGWSAVYAELLAEHGDDIAALTALYPDRWVRLDGDVPSRPVDEVRRLREFTEDVLLRRCHEHVRDVLASTGRDTIGWGDEEVLVRRLTEAVRAEDPELAAGLAVRTTRISPVEDPAEFDRQAVRLREPMEVRVVPVDSPLLDTGLRVAVWLSRDAARRQFRFPPDVELPDVVVALLNGLRTPDGRAVVGLLPSTTTPAELRERGIDAAVLTTQTTLTTTGVQDVLRGEEVCVLLDGRVARTFDEWLARGDVTMTYVLDRVSTDDFGDLDVLVFALDRLPGFRLVAVCGTYAAAMLLGYLKTRHPALVRPDPGLADGERTALAVAIVLRLWSVLGNGHLRG